MKAISFSSVVKKGWTVLVAAAVVAAAGSTIYRLHGLFGSRGGATSADGISGEIVPFNPKQVVLEVFGVAGAVATIDYLDVNAQPQQVIGAHLPWSFTITTTEPAVLGSLVAQGDGDTLGCRITVNGEVKDQRTVNTSQAYTYCLEKSG
ncbi:MmpS family transport accessory protein [Mycobacterium sp.]|uniref:MmpS family transport accessory protein n=1 Tax=Mycobacterium sp. TaxID=1785 RepID=UPI000CAFACF9|nr:MmpS family transport accessory protein [Mycobacterium sp.]PJE12580.1 MAG: transport acessory protein MmpS [Mycobacterium sp.]